MRKLRIGHIGWLGLDQGKVYETVVGNRGHTYDLTI